LREFLQKEDVHIVEIDTVLLGDIFDVIEEWQLEDVNGSNDIFLYNSVKINGTNFGIPRLLCSYFLFTYSDEIAKASIFEEFASLVGNFYFKINNVYGDNVYFNMYKYFYPNTTQEEL
jgi:hypothetical protein